MEKLLIPHKNHLYLIPYAEIIFFKSDNCYVETHLADNRKFVLTTSLSKFQHEINRKDFIKISQSFLINKNFIISIDKKGRLINLINNHQVPFTITIKSLIEMIW